MLLDRSSRAQPYPSHYWHYVAMFKAYKADSSTRASLTQDTESNLLTFHIAVTILGPPPVTYP